MGKSEIIPLFIVITLLAAIVIGNMVLDSWNTRPNTSYGTVSQTVTQSSGVNEIPWVFSPGIEARYSYIVDQFTRGEITLKEYLSYFTAVTNISWVMIKVEDFIEFNDTSAINVPNGCTIKEVTPFGTFIKGKVIRVVTGDSGLEGREIIFYTTNMIVKDKKIIFNDDIYPLLPNRTYVMPIRVIDFTPSVMVIYRCGENYPATELPYKKLIGINEKVYAPYETLIYYLGKNGRVYNLMFSMELRNVDPIYKYVPKSDLPAKDVSGNKHILLDPIPYEEFATIVKENLPKTNP